MAQKEPLLSFSSGTETLDRREEKCHIFKTKLFYWEYLQEFGLKFQIASFTII